jgi:hypothetical protein
MKQYFFEIVRQKWRLLMVILFLLLFNITLGIVVSAYQLPSLINLQIKWSDLRHKAGSNNSSSAGICRSRKTEGQHS